MPLLDLVLIFYRELVISPFCAHVLYPLEGVDLLFSILNLSLTPSWKKSPPSILSS